MTTEFRNVIKVSKEELSNILLTKSYNFAINFENKKTLKTKSISGKIKTTEES